MSRNQHFIHLLLVVSLSFNLNDDSLTTFREHLERFRFFILFLRSFPFVAYPQVPESLRLCFGLSEIMFILDTLGILFVLQ